MAEEEVSYYEIALTSRQVLVSFIVGLACVALAFFAGVWVGQQEPETEPVAATEEIETEGAEAQTPQLDFFERADDTVAEESASPAPDRAAAKTNGRSRDVTTAGTAPASGAIILQVLSTPNQKTADDFLARLTEAGYSGYIQSFDNSGQVFYRLRLGPFADRGAAESTKKQVDATFNVQALITTAE